LQDIFFLFYSFFEIQRKAFTLRCIPKSVQSLDGIFTLGILYPKPIFHQTT